MAGLGATLRIKMDTSAVRRGITSIRGMFSRLGSVVRGFGSVLRKAMSPMMLVFGALASGAAIKGVADFGSHMSDIAVSSQTTVANLMVIKDALRRAGAKGDTDRILLTLKKQIQEAIISPTGEIAKAFARLKLDPRRLRTMDVADAFDLIARRVESTGDEINGLEFSLDRIFGGRLTRELLKLFRDYSANMAKAEDSVLWIGEFFDKHKTLFDDFADALGKIPDLFRVVVGQLMVMSGLMPKITKFVEELKPLLTKEFLRNTLIWLREEIWGWVKKLWNWMAEKAVEIGEKIAQGVINKLPWLEGFGSKGMEAAKASGGMIKGFVGGGLFQTLDNIGTIIDQFFKAKTKPWEVKSDPKTTSTLQHMDRTLTEIARKGGAQFA